MLRRLATSSLSAVAALLAAVLPLGPAAAGPADAPPAGMRAAAAAAAAADNLTYEPYRLVHSISSTAEVDRFLTELDRYGIGQPLLQTPRFHQSGALRIPAQDLLMFGIWAAEADAYNATHGTDIAVTAVFNGEVKTDRRGLDLDDPATRATMVAGIESLLTTGIDGVHLDLEPYPVTDGFLTLLGELNTMFDRVGFTGRLSVVAPAHTSKWTPSYVNQVSQLVDQVNPLCYDSSFQSAAKYEDWVVESVAYYTANVVETTRIVPVIPSYSANRWHQPGAENIDTATAALTKALAAGSRVNGAGIWWWWGFFYDEEGAYDASRDRVAWQERTVDLPFTP